MSAAGCTWDRADAIARRDALASWLAEQEAPVDIAAMVEALGCGERTIRRHLRLLRDEGRVLAPLHDGRRRLWVAA